MTEKSWEYVIQKLDNPDKLTYQPIEHPYFADWGAMQICTDRLQMMLEYVGEVEGKRILDIGFCYGWFCHKLAKLGARVVGVEVSPNKVDIAKALSVCYGFPPTNPEFLYMRYQDYLKDGEYFDMIIYLSNFHHELRDYGPEAAWRGMNLISKSTSLMFLDMDEYHSTEWMRLHGPAPEWEPELVLIHTEFTKFTPLRPSHAHGRMMYAFEKGGK